MRPKNWNQMSAEQQREEAFALFGSMRGRLIIGQALAKAVAVMSVIEHPETSNIEDMELLGETLFQPFFSMFSSKGERKDVA